MTDTNTPTGMPRDTSTPTEKLVRCKQIWRETMAHKAKAERLVLELMRHPEAVAEHFVQAHKSLQASEGLLRQAVTGLRKAYPMHKSQFFLQHAWWGEEFNRYDEALKTKANNVSQEGEKV